MKCSVSRYKNNYTIKCSDGSPARHFASRTATKAAKLAYALGMPQSCVADLHDHTDITIEWEK